MVYFSYKSGSFDCIETRELHTNSFWLPWFIASTKPRMFEEISLSLISKHIFHAWWFKLFLILSTLCPSHTGRNLAITTSGLLLALPLLISALCAEATFTSWIINWSLIKRLFFPLYPRSLTVVINGWPYLRFDRTGPTLVVHLPLNQF